MTSKEIQEMIIDLEDQIERFGVMNTFNLQLSILKSYKQDLERLEALEQENKEYFEIITKQAYLLNNKHIDRPFIEILQQENEKLKKAIEILKDHVQFKLVPIVSNDAILEGAYHFGIKIDKYGYYATLPKIEAEVLKEVLEND
jgi:protein subunit release factor A